MIELEKTDPRYIALTSKDAIINSYVRMKIGDTYHTFLASARRHVVYEGDTVHPSAIVGLVTPKQELMPNANTGNCIIIDEDFLTPATSIGAALQTHGPSGIPVEVGIYGKVNGAYTEPLTTMRGRSVNVFINKKEVTVNFVDLLQNIDASHTVTATSSSQRDIDPTDDALDEIGGARQGAFGGPFRD